MNDFISTDKMPSENMRCGQVFTGIFAVKIGSFIFLSQYGDMKTIFYLFYKTTKVFLSFHDVIHALYSNTK